MSFGKRTPSTVIAILLLIAGTVRSQELKVFFGNLHSHTSLSDGSGTPEQAYEHARTVGLDFLAITEHNHPRAEDSLRNGDPRKDGILIGRHNALYEGPAPDALVPVADRMSETGKFIALYGQEFSAISRGNHVNVFDVPKVIRMEDVPNGKFDLLLNWMQNNRDSTGAVAVMQLNHPALTRRDDPRRTIEYGADDFPSRAEWFAKVGGAACLIEILNGPSEAQGTGNRAAEVAEDEYRHYLKIGFRVAPSGDQDNHFLTWGSATDVRTAVITDELTKPKLLAAMRNRRVYATEDKNLRLIFKINGHLCGDKVAPPAPDSDLRIEYQIIDDDEPNATYRIDVFSGTVGAEMPTVINSIDDDAGNSQPNTFRTIEDVKYTGGQQYFYFRVRQGEDESGGTVDRAWTAPVWFDAGAAPDGDDGIFIASRRSAVYHISEECRSVKAIKDSNRITGLIAKEGRRLHEGCPQR